MKKGLYIIAVPIGNLSDISERAKSTLEACNIIACEDTRVTKKLLSLLNLSTKKTFIPLHDHNEEEKSQKIIELINDGNPVALVSDAGSPLISDPGYKLVHKLKQNNLPITTIPGACAIVCALQLSALPTNRFMFAGFVPNKDKARKDLFQELKDIQTTLVFYETAPRLIKTLETAKAFFQNRLASVARELTKVYEESITDSIDNLILHYTKNPPKGEIVLIFAPPLQKEVKDIDIEKILKSKLKELTLKIAVKQTVEETGLPKNFVYEQALKLKDKK